MSSSTGIASDHGKRLGQAIRYPFGHADCVPQSATSEVLLGTPATAHILGGCNIGSSAEEGVIDKNHEVFSHSGLFACDGSVIPTNLGVNPSLTITALAERFSLKVFWTYCLKWQGLFIYQNWNLFRNL